MKLLLGIDLGTSYFKLGLFDSVGVLKGLGRVAVDPETPAPGRFELSVAAFWDRLRRALAEALAQAGVGTDEIAGISYSSQANTFLLLDDAGVELTPLVFWNDQRACPLDEVMAEFGLSKDFGTTTGMLEVASECMPVKCCWFARHEPQVWARMSSVMTISDYLTYTMTNNRVGDASTAVLTGLYSLPAQSWWSEALAFYGIQREELSLPLPPGSVGGHTGSQVAELLGLPMGIPFAVGALDHHAAALGAGLGEFADVSLSTGTVLAALVLVDKVSPIPGCIHGPHTDGKQYYRLAFDINGAGQLEHYQRLLAPALSIDDLLQLAERFARELSNGSRSDGILAEHGASVFALLKKIATSQQGLLAQVTQSVPVKRITATGGGARSPFWLQVTADTIGLPVRAVATTERACLGAAMLAAVAAGFWPNLTTASRHMLKPPQDYFPIGRPS